MNRILSISYLILGLFMISCEKDELKVKTVEKLTISSTNTGQNYRMQILLPDNYSESNSYPVVYLLDGYFWFNDLGNEAIDLMSENQISDIVLVSIEYNDYPFSVSNAAKIDELRTNDLTYPSDSNNGEYQGGYGLEFYSFLKSELIPQIESQYSIDTNSRAIFGHSLGGYFTLFQMMNFEEDALFNNVVSISPSLWWADLNLFELEQQLSVAGNDLPFNLYLSIGNLEGVEMNVLSDELNSRLKNHSYPNLNLQFESYSAGHNESARIGFTNALKYLYQ